MTVGMNRAGSAAATAGVIPSFAATVCDQANVPAAGNTLRGSRVSPREAFWLRPRGQDWRERVGDYRVRPPDDFL